MKIILFVPCYNVASTVLKVMDQIPAEILKDLYAVFLIDNGSTDGTRDLLSRYVASHPDKFRLFLNSQNYSLGGSAIIAIREALKLNADFLICMHSDGQADPEDLRKFFPLRKTEDFVFGSRMLAESRTQNYSKIRTWGNIFFAKLQKRILKNNVRDLGAFVGLNLQTVGRYPYQKIPADMGYFPLLVLYLATRQKLNCREFPIFWGEVKTSNVNIWAYGLKHLVRLLKIYSGLFWLTPVETSHYKTEKWSPQGP